MLKHRYLVSFLLLTFLVIFEMSCSVDNDTEGPSGDFVKRLKDAPAKVIWLMVQ
jgi:hypothetical protein